AGPGDVAEGTQIRGLLCGEDGGPGEAFGDQRVAQGELDDVADVRADRRQPLPCRNAEQGGAAGQDPAAQQPGPGGVLVQAQQGFLDAQRVGIEHAVADVVAQGADVTDVVVQAFQFQQDRAHPSRLDGYLQVQGVLDRAAVREGVSDGGVPGDTFGEEQAGGDVAAFEQFLHAFVDVPQAGLEFEDGLPDDGEPEVAGF